VDITSEKGLNIKDVIPTNKDTIFIFSKLIKETNIGE